MGAVDWDAEGRQQNAPANITTHVRAGQKQEEDGDSDVEDDEFLARDSTEVQSANAPETALQIGPPQATGNVSTEAKVQEDAGVQSNSTAHLAMSSAPGVALALAMPPYATEPLAEKLPVKLPLNASVPTTEPPANASSSQRALSLHRSARSRAMTTDGMSTLLSRMKKLASRSSKQSQASR